MLCYHAEEREGEGGGAPAVVLEEVEPVLHHQGALEGGQLGAHHVIGTCRAGQSRTFST